MIDHVVLNVRDLSQIREARQRALDLAKQQGAHRVFDHSKGGYVEEILSATGGKGVDVVLEMLANVNLSHDTRLLANDGRVIVIGSRGEVTINPRELMGRRASIRGFTLWAVTPEEEADTFVAALVPLFTILTGAFGTAALEASITTPVMLPRSDCAKATVAVAKKIKSESLIVICYLLRGGTAPHTSVIVLLEGSAVKEILGWRFQGWAVTNQGAGQLVPGSAVTG